MTTNMRTWCCIQQGDSSIRTYFEKNVYVVGETANICSEIDNSKCNLNIKSIDTSLINTLILKA